MNVIQKYAPTAQDAHANTPLTQISIAYLQDESRFISTRVFPNIPVQKQADRYWTYDRGEFNRDEMKKRAPGTESAGGSYTIDNTPTYFCHVYGIHKDIPDELRANEDTPLSSDRDSTIWLSQKALIKKEKIWANTFFKLNVWDTDFADAHWDPADSGGSDPIIDIRTGKRTILESTGQEANTLVLAKAVYDSLADNPDIIDRLNSGQTAPNPAMGTLWAMMALFEIPRILICSGIENTAKEGQPAEHSFIGGANALLCHSAPSPGILTPSAGYTFSWNGYLGAGTFGNRMTKFRHTLIKSDRIELEMAFDMKLIGADLGYFFDTPLDPS